MPPSVPHVSVLCELHVPPEQHPLGQEAASHTHAPDTQACPCTHWVWPPHVHVPDVHPSAVMPQGEHVPPFAPHADADGVEHVVPVQQPLGQLVLLQLAQVPALHIKAPQS
jgi:hypothetical protein